MGVAPSSASSPAITSAAAPSVMPGALPAVTVPPSGWNAGFSFASASVDVSRRGFSSTLTVSGPFLPWTVTGTSSASNAPLSMAAMARSCDRSANASCASRVTSCFAATRSAWTPMWTSQLEHHRPSCTVLSTTVWLPSR